MKTVAETQAHWDKTPYPELYKFSRRLEDVVIALRVQNRAGHPPHHLHIEELDDLAASVKVLHRQYVRGFSASSPVNTGSSHEETYQ